MLLVCMLEQRRSMITTLFLFHESSLQSRSRQHCYELRLDGGSRQQRYVKGLRSRFLNLLEFACGSASSAYRRWIICWGHSHNVANAHLDLQVAIAWTMIMREEHEYMMRKYIRIISMGGEDHLTPNSIFSRSNCYLFTIFSDYKFTRFLAHKTAWPEHKGNNTALEPLFSQSLTCILAEWWRIRNDEAEVLTACYMVKPATKPS